MIAIPIIIFLAFLAQGITGFGSGLIGMSLLISVIDVQIAAPLFALVALTGEFISLVRFREHLKFSAVWRLAVPSMLAIPVGILLAQRVADYWVLLILGIILVSYGSYSLLVPRLPELRHPNWAFPFGFVGGLLSGAYNTGGPPVVIYGNLARWEAKDYKSSLQGYFITNSLLVSLVHLRTGHITADVQHGVLLALPAMLIGLVVGWRVERYFSPTVFRRMVMILLIVIGARLILLHLPGVLG
jgi:uncharacterized membrane protein YfcA